MVSTFFIAGTYLHYLAARDNTVMMTSKRFLLSFCVHVREIVLIYYSMLWQKSCTNISLCYTGNTWVTGFTRSCARAHTHAFTHAHAHAQRIFHGFRYYFLLRPAPSPHHHHPGPKFVCFVTTINIYVQPLRMCLFIHCQNWQNFQFWKKLLFPLFQNQQTLPSPVSSSSNTGRRISTLGFVHVQITLPKFNTWQVVADLLKNYSHCTWEQVPFDKRFQEVQTFSKPKLKTSYFSRAWN